MNASVAPAKKREGSSTGRYSKGLNNQNWEHPVDLCESNNLGRQVTFPSDFVWLYWKLYFPTDVQITY